ncbi:ammonium transporter [Tuwongella immobilis]|uniref:Ammonium transporter AmtB-like domain-containing protein n=1 Tax=Tuwongella immobilis TaxID=692036 RepID=A0A6C2YJ61_9BACT|nr:ammonium transporter [Tuwongella immobilis]VIP01590.1 ammonium transporter : Ammonium transporter OS=Pedosphaera parvula (strain Ellin514) GN=Cflav_PD3952 PE=4 SV=1: Ammonium_transp [Tuwongella immobilis]VTR98860.1 ammonium transporter : Ammonium transporter OS=Pedosphaera parvula (strain Ellin514) GN=Cflav_PD3952 PE=4 SV=1: Ammonium_transp [Tuwongella immobilis]
MRPVLSRWAACLSLLILGLFATSAFAEGAFPDPTGSQAGVAITPAADGKGDPPANTLTNADLYQRIAHNAFSINILWVLIAGFMVMFMQAGFALVETGLCRAKNASHVIMTNFMIYPLACIAFWAYGFALGWGNWYHGPVAPGWYSTLGPGTELLNQGFGLGPEIDPATGRPSGNQVYQYGIFGTTGFFLMGMEDVSVLCLFFFMMLFFDTTATIPTGALAERWSWGNFCLYGLWVALPYCLFAGWVWGGGWLAQSGINWGLGHGAVDFAGSGVVHAMGGAISLAGVLVLGPRTGKYVQGRPQAIPGHNIPMVVLGTFILAFGWFGFNAGSTLAGTDLRISVAVVNTMLASIAGAISAMMTLYAKGMKPDPSMLCNGMLAGLVAVTASCAFISPWAGFVIGMVAGFLVVVSVLFIEDSGIDDPVGAISVHGINGIWGVIALGLFANGKYGAGWNGVTRPEYVERFGSDGVRGLLYGDATQLMAQLLEAGVALLFGFAMAYVMFRLTDRIIPMRVRPEYEQFGLDVPEMGAIAYPDHTVQGQR